MPLIETSEARKLYREFTPDMIECAYGKFLLSGDGIKEILSGTAHHTKEDIIRRRPNLQFLEARAPEMVTLSHLIRQLHPGRVLNQDPLLQEKFMTIGKQLELDGDTLGISNAFPQDFQTSLYVQLGIVAAFTPRLMRPSLSHENIPLFGSDISTIFANTPDLSHLKSPEERLQGITAMLTMNHTDVIKVVCETMGIPADMLDELHQTDPDKWKEIHRLTGNFLSRNSFYGVLSREPNNVFKMSPERTQKAPQMSDRGHCPAQPFVKVWLQGVGQALQTNENAVLDAITTW